MSPFVSGICVVNGHESRDCIVTNKAFVAFNFFSNEGKNKSGSMKCKQRQGANRTGLRLATPFRTPQESSFAASCSLYYTKTSTTKSNKTKHKASPD